MKLLFLPALALLSFSFPKQVTNNNLQNRDTAVINHVLDGSISEWPANKFEQDIPTGIKYAIDNDATSLYIAMVVPANRVQLKMIAQGMELYVDVRGKKREEKGIAFPVPKTSASFTEVANSAAAQNGANKVPDFKAIRGAMALNIFSLKLIGFSDDEAKDQELMQPGSANLQYTWDDADVMYVEYSIPLNLFSDNSLNQKSISLGWKLNALDFSSPGVSVTSVTRTTTSSQVQTTRGRGPGSGNTAFNQPDRSPDALKEQSFWAKYTVIIPAK